MSNQQLTPSPTRPYIARAIYEWLNDNQLTPHLLVDATRPYTTVPEQFIQDGQIVLNIAPHAVHRFQISNDAISFSARFGGVSRDLYVPMSAVLGLYARENGQGMFFDPDEYADIEENGQQDETTTEQTSEPTKKKPSLRILD